MSRIWMLARRKRNCRSHWYRLEIMSDWSCICSLFPRAILFSERAHHGPWFKIRVSRAFGRGLSKNNSCSPTSPYHPPGAKPTYRTHGEPCPLGPCAFWILGNRMTRQCLVVSSRSSRKRCPDGEVRTSHRVCFGSVRCLVPADISWFSQFFGADSPVSLKSAHIGDRGPVLGLIDC
jgi:hypothetical protein